MLPPLKLEGLKVLRRFGRRSKRTSNWTRKLLPAPLLFELVHVDVLGLAEAVEAAEAVERVPLLPLALLVLRLRIRTDRVVQ